MLFVSPKNLVRLLLFYTTDSASPVKVRLAFKNKLVSPLSTFFRLAIVSSLVVKTTDLSFSRIYSDVLSKSTLLNLYCPPTFAALFDWLFSKFVLHLFRSLLLFLRFSERYFALVSSSHCFKACFLRLPEFIFSFTYVWDFSKTD